MRSPAYCPGRATRTASATHVAKCAQRTACTRYPGPQSGLQPASLPVTECYRKARTAPAQCRRCGAVPFMRRCAAGGMRIWDPCAWLAVLNDGEHLREAGGSVGLCEIIRCGVSARCAAARHGVLAGGEHVRGIAGGREGECAAALDGRGGGVQPARHRLHVRLPRWVAKMKRSPRRRESKLMILLLTATSRLVISAFTGKPHQEAVR
jgi:hypothetical protein